MKSTKYALSLVCVAALTACGGGGGGAGPADSGTINPLAGAPECTIGGVTYGKERILPETCTAVQKAYNDAVKSGTDAKDAAASATAQLAAANKSIADLQATSTATAKALADVQLAANDANNALIKANDELAKAKADLANSGNQAAVDRAAAEVAAAKAAKDKADAALLAAEAANDKKIAAGDRQAATDALAAAQLVSAQTTADAAQAAKDKADADKAKADAQLLALQAATAQENANQTLLNAQAARDAAKTDADKAAADKALAEAAQTKAAADVQAANAIAAEAAAIQAATVAIAQQAAMDRDQANAALAEMEAIRNTTGLPICSTLPAGTIPLMGDNCVYTFADQVALVNGVKFVGLYANEVAILLAETDGTIWAFDQTYTEGQGGESDVTLGKISTSNGKTFTATGKSLSFTKATTNLSGPYTKDFTTVKIDYSRLPNEKVNVSRSFNMPADARYETNLVVEAGAMGGQNNFTGNHNAQLTVAANNVDFTGFDASCLYTGKFLTTGKGYNKVQITWGEGCAGITPGTIGNGVISVYGEGAVPIYVLIANTKGTFADVGFTTFFNRFFPVAPATQAIEAKSKKVEAKTLIEKVTAGQGRTK